MSTTYTPGKLVKIRDREWVVQPSGDPDILLLKPLGGSEEETTGIYIPLEFAEDEPQEVIFPHPTSEDLGDFSRAKLLHDASRLSFRNGAGPFRCLAKLSFRPRSYQMVPLIMALRQEIVRLLIADDVGVGKTIEALLIMKEMLERRTVKRFAVICLPHLCDQWQQEIKDKIGIEAVVIRSNTQAKLDRENQGDVSVFERYPYQIISIDYIKTDQRARTFTALCPELIIVDEVHTCARPEGASDQQQKRFSLLHDIAQKENQHLIMLSATPHSGKAAQFASLLGLLKPEFETLDITTSDTGNSQRQSSRRKLARHFVQRRRSEVEKWMHEDTPFPTREPGEYNYDLTPEYNTLFDDVLTFVRNLISDNDSQKKVHYWTALGLLRGVMSSPAAGISMLKNRREKIITSDELSEFTSNPVLDSSEGFDSDLTPKELIENTDWSWRQIEQLKDFETRLESLSNPKADEKLLTTHTIVENWLEEGFNPVIFCRYISTASYVGEQLKALFAKSKSAKLRKTRIEIVTSEDPDELRRARINDMEDSELRVLIATDCLSEGINLHELFTAVLHYDLPWNPNRLEQREGRVDRFGQTSPTVKTWLLFSKENPVDGVVLNVILRKVVEIKKATGINIPFPEDSQSILETITESLLISAENKVTSRKTANQIEFSFDEFDEAKKISDQVSDSFNRAAEREKVTRSIFAQNAIKAEEIEKDLMDNDKAIGDPSVVQNFVCNAVELLGGQIDAENSKSTQYSFTLQRANLPASLIELLPKDGASSHSVSFHSPCPRDHIYLGRNHLFVEQLCQILLTNTMERDSYAAARAAVIRTDAVSEITTIYLLRARNVIHERTNTTNEHVAEEMILTGFTGDASDLDSGNILSQDECYGLLYTAKATSELSPERRGRVLSAITEKLPELKQNFDDLALSRAQNLVEAHERFSRHFAQDRYGVVQPVLPMDILGIYNLLPAN